ncbi:MAG: NAD-dependent epimerase/dehydratase family protein, partial [Thaumarchaeota archaeon]|nr:NAD-dependent epimerase/dehydratase family protein [Nitrososphaerota archaeon]
MTGGAGFIGSHLVDRLLSMSARVVVLDDLSNGKTANLPLHAEGLEVLSGDVSTYDLSSLGRIDGAFTEAARALLPSFQDPIGDMVVNAGGLVRVLELARQGRFKVVHASSGSVYGNPQTVPIREGDPAEPISPYGVSKLSSEHYCSMYHREFGVQVTALRYFNVYGPRQAVSEEMGVIPIFVHRALHNEPLTVFGDGKQTRDFLNVSDVVSANLLAFLSEKSVGRVMNIGGGGKEVSILELARTVIALCDSKSETRFGPPKPGDIRRLAADSS